MPTVKRDCRWQIDDGNIFIRVSTYKKQVHISVFEIGTLENIREKIRSPTFLKKLGFIKDAEKVGLLKDYCIPK